MTVLHRVAPRGALLLLAALALAGCAGDSSTESASAPTSAASTASTVATPTPTPTPTPSTSASPATAPPATASGAAPSSDAGAYAGFVSPSNNIRCGMTSGPDGDGARCDIADKDWQAPPQPADCEFDWGSSLFLGEDDAGLACVSDAVDASEVLAYGQSKRLGDVVCHSSRTGVRCEHLGSKRAFELSRARYSLF